MAGTYGHFAPAVWLYAGHMLLIFSSLLAIAMSFVQPRWALWALALNFAAPLLRRWSQRGTAAG